MLKFLIHLVSPNERPLQEPGLVFLLLSKDFLKTLLRSGAKKIWALSTL